MGRITLRALLLAGCASAMIATAGPAAAQTDAAVQFDIPAQPLGAALNDFAQQSKVEILFSSQLARDRRAPPVRGEMAPGDALGILLAQSGLTYRATSTGSFVIETAAPQSSGAVGDGAEVEALIVTAQKREEDIQDVPIAISAFTQESLNEQKIEGGYDLLKAIPNVTFSKSNYSGYNFSIRGVGTKAVSATSDPGVAVSFNNTSLIRNRLFEQEYLDVERVEVLRGPQGTLYGRNATAGVINVVTAKPRFNDFAGQVKAEVGNFDARRMSAFVNLPVLDDRVAIRLAGSATERDGYGKNLLTGTSVDGRDLWSTRVSVGFNPTDRISTNLVWERFEEDDDRLRTGKQLCHRDPGPEQVGDRVLDTLSRGRLSQGCKPGSLYEDGAFGAPNGLSIPFVIAGQYMATIGRQGGERIYLLQRGVDPFGGTQSHDMRAMESLYEPEYQAKADILALTVDVDLTDTLTVTSQTLYNEDYVYSFQDYHRFATIPTINDSAPLGPVWWAIGATTNPLAGVTAGGIFDDPQIGPSDRLAGMEVSSSDSTQFGQEIRIQSDFDGPLNFSAGANYTRFKGVNEYYLFYNVVTAIAHIHYNRSPDLVSCNNDPVCIYIDTSPRDNLTGDGHNYFRNQNPYKLESKAVFGEAYWEASDALKVTAGLRYTDDRKSFTPWRSQLMVEGEGYGPGDPINQRWTAVTGRLGVDWSPELSFTDDTLLYAFYSHGYKGGGANPPPAAALNLFGTPFEPAEHPMTFKPEYVDALEVGAKNTLLGGALTLNGSAFLYDYADYQISKVVDRTVVNENFDARVWGVEFEGVWRPTNELRINATLGYLDSKIGDGERSLDVFDRTAGNDDWMVVTPWIQQTSNCILPVWLIEELSAFPLGSTIGSNPFVLACASYTVPELAFFGFDFDPADFPEINNGAGFYKDVGGNELPNAPHWTFNIGAQYTFDLVSGWEATVRGDYYHQGDSYARVYNEIGDELRGWDNANLSLRIERPEDALTFELYAKNIFDDTPITDAFLNSDSTGMTTNVFTLDPRLIGLSITKGF